MIPRGAPKPPPDLWNELVRHAREGNEYGFNVAAAKYKTWLHEQDIEGHPDPLHGHAPTEIDDDEDGIF